MANPAAQAAMAVCRDDWQWPPDARLTPLADLHLTLCFLGVVPDEHVARLRLELAAVEMEPLALVFSRAELWPSGVAVLRPEHDERLRALRADVAAVVSRIGLPTEARPWKPHLTLARHAVGARPPVQPFALSWAVRQFSLVASKGGSATGYEALESWPR